ncbi:hypothetical protein RS3R1_18340 [Pseudomonas atacamensis]|uniref:Uncharacterized protein n=1 Tax=Pseudomonas atacamensis TaxID=2565368 RepID=A0ABQ5PGX5_9PSED|nr:hypothetical protein RS3R1_18340 [Pseudomonas atacamensis]
MTVMRLTANTPRTITSKAIKAKPRKARGAIFRLRRDMVGLSKERNYERPCREHWPIAGDSPAALNFGFVCA